MAEGAGDQGGHRHIDRGDDDPFANFSYNPPKPTGHLRGFARRNRYRAMAGLSVSRERIGSLHGSNSSLATLVGEQYDACK